MTDRDHFAAAALTGLLARGLLQSNLLATDAYKVADAMLRERERTNHDAAPAARANAESVAPQPTAGDRAGNPPSHSGTGDTPATHATQGEGSEQRECTEPVAWAVMHPNDEVGVIAFNRCRAEAYATASDRVVPLYRHPPCQDFSQKNLTLTDAEPVAWAVMLADGERIYDVYATEEEAKAIDEAVTGNHGFVPLYRKPTLTDAEREAVSVWARALQGLFERMGGGK